MPSLTDTLQAQQQKSLVRDAQGNLTQAPQKDLQQLVGQAGLPAAPTTAIGQSMIGATPDQQKMAGSPQQKQLALQQSAGPQKDLATTLREQQVNNQPSAQAQKEASKSEDMKNLGQLGDRVTDFVDAQRQKLETAASAAGSSNQPQVNAATGQFNGVDLAGIKPQLDALRANPSDQNALLAVNQALGMDQNNQISPDQLNQLYESSVSAISRAGGQNVQQNLTANDLINMGGLGYDANQLSQLLEVPPDQVGKMSIADIQNQIHKIGGQEFSTAAGIDQKAQSGVLGGAERGLAHQAGQEASATGLRATESNYADLQKQIDGAGTVQFNGQQMSVSDALSNDNISKTITDYLNAPPGSAERAQLDKNEPQLADFINKNQAVLDDAAKQMSAGEKTFQETQTSNKALANIGGIQVDPNVMKQIIPGYDQMSANKIDTSKSGVLSYVQGLPPQSQTKIANELNANPDAAGQLANLSKDEVQKLGIDQSYGPWVQYKKASQQNQQFQSLDPKDTNSVISAFTGGAIASADQAKQLVQNNKTNYLLGTGSTTDTDDLEKILSGKMDGKQYLLAHSNPGSLKDLAAGGEAHTYTPAQMSPMVADTSPAAQDVLKRLGAQAATGEVTPAQIKSAGLNLDDLIYLRNGQSHLDSATVNSMYTTARAQNTTQLAEGVLAKGGGDLNLQMQGLQEMYNNATSSNDPKIAPEVIQDYMNKVKLGMQAQQAAANQPGGGGMQNSNWMGADLSSPAGVIATQGLSSPYGQNRIATLGKSGWATDELGAGSKNVNLPNVATAAPAVLDKIRGL